MLMLRKRIRFTLPKRLILVLAISLVGVVALFLAKAASSSVSVEPSTGNLSCAELPLSASSASANSFVRFKNGLCGSTAVNVNDWTVVDDSPPQDSPVLVRGEREGNFRVICWASHLNFDDPIVNNPADPTSQGKAHMHMFFGNTLANYKSTYETLKNTGDGTCSGGPLNRSAYWIPAMLDPSGKARIPSVINVYYKTQNVSRLSMHYLPEGLRMIAGDAKAMSPQTYDTLPHEWNCVDGSVTKQAVIPSSCTGRTEDNKGLQLVMSFPQCWDGVNLDSTNHKSHMAYHEQGVCPASHPVALPEVTYNILWSVPTGSTSGWYLSSDKMKMPDGTTMNMPGGTTVHGDWFGGWNVGVMQTFVDNCLIGGKDAQWGRLCNGRRLKAVPNYNTAISVDPPLSTTSQVNLPRPF